MLVHYSNPLPLSICKSVFVGPRYRSPALCPLTKIFFSLYYLTTATPCNGDRGAGMLDTAVFVSLLQDNILLIHFYNSKDFLRFRALHFELNG